VRQPLLEPIQQLLLFRCAPPGASKCPLPDVSVTCGNAALLRRMATDQTARAELRVLRYPEVGAARFGIRVRAAVGSKMTPSIKIPKETGGQQKENFPSGRDLQRSATCCAFAFVME